VKISKEVQINVIIIKIEEREKKKAHLEIMDILFKLKHFKLDFFMLFLILCGEYLFSNHEERERESVEEFFENEKNTKLKYKKRKKKPAVKSEERMFSV
jgi:hypothetical protein